MKKFLLVLVFIMVLGFTNQAFALDSNSATTCSSWKVTSGSPQGGTYWESLHLDTSKHPEIQQYRIQWFNGSWSDWYVPGVGDKDSKVNDDGTSRLLWSYFQDHNYQTRTCGDNSAQTITVLSPNGGEVYTVGQKVNVKWISSNISANTNVRIFITHKNGSADQVDTVVSGSGDGWTNNDGEQIITIPPLSWTGFQVQKPGTFYDVFMEVQSLPTVTDRSDSLFTINTSSSLSCSDSDGGKNIDIFGLTDDRVNGIGSYFNDSSVGSNGGICTGASCTGVAEGYCENDKVENIVIQCPSGYSANGVCISKTGTKASITVLTPNGGENYKPGDKITIRWKTNNLPYNPGTQVDIMDDRINGWSTASLFGTVPALDYAKLVSSNGTEYIYEYTFIVPQNFNSSLPSQYQGIFGGQHYKFQITISNKNNNGTYQWVADDLSDKLFNIQATSARSITVLSPNGGENYVPGQQITIKWTSKGIPANDNNFHLVVSKAYTTERIYLMGYNDATSKTVNDGVEIVTLPKSLAKGLYKIEISRLGNGVGDYDVYDDSDGGFNVNYSPVDYPTAYTMPTTPVAQPTPVSTPVAPITKTLRPGIRNDMNVKVLQQALIGQGYLNGVADGSYGPKTLRAVQDFQRAKRLTPDGLVGRMTWSVLHTSAPTTMTTTTTTATTTPTTTTQFPWGCTSNRGYSSTTGQACSGTTAISTNDPYIHIYGSSANTVSDTSVTVKMGDKFIISGIPQNMQGLSYHYGVGYPGAGKYNMSYNFDQKFGDNNICGNNDSTTNATWAMTCAARVLGSSDFYIEINSNGRVFRSNIVKVTIVPNTNTACTPDSAPLFKVVSPNGGEIFSAGEQVTVKWTSCNIPKNNSASIELVVPSMNWTIGLISNKIYNDGEEIITLPNSIRIPEMPYGKLFKMQVSSSDQLSVDVSDNLFTINPANTNIPIIVIPPSDPKVMRAACPDFSLVSGGPQGGTAWEELHLDASKHPEICQYRIQWFNGSWSDWYTPGVGDKDSKVNNDGTERLLWSYFQDHNWQKRLYR